MMGKSSPVERWNQHNIELIAAFRLSGELPRLRKTALASLSRKTMYSFQEWWDDFSNRATSRPYREWYNEQCTPAADKFGLAPLVVSNLCLLDGYRPEADIGLTVVEAQWPRVRLVTNSTDDEFVSELFQAAKQFGLYIVQEPGTRNGPAESKGTDPDGMHANRTVGGSARDRTFFVRIEIPVEYPPEAASQLARRVSQASKELARTMGRPVPKRMRNSPLASTYEDLKMTVRRLPRLDSYDIADQLHPDGDSGQEQRRRKAVSSRRYKVSQRLVKPYETRGDPTS
jgi:hypothetical protein